MFDTVAAQRLSERGGANQSTLRRTTLPARGAPAARVQPFVIGGGTMTRALQRRSVDPQDLG
ncbi:MAG: hypothetical protein DMF75_19215, partial [Acidobacteria bacterium]